MAKKSGSTSYVPNCGDVVWLTFDPQAGHEQAGRRPALILSPRSYNETVGLAIVCPVTSRVKGYPFEVKIKGGRINGVILSDQIRNIDWKARKARFVQTAERSSVLKTARKINMLLPAS